MCWKDRWQLVTTDTQIAFYIDLTLPADQAVAEVQLGQSNECTLEVK